MITISGALASYDPPRLFPVDISTGSGPSANFKLLLDDYASWSTHLREEAVKVFLHFTDSNGGDGSSIEGYGDAFDTELYTRDPAQFGASVEDRKLVYHATVGLKENEPPTAAWLPSDPVQDAACTNPAFSGAPGPGQGFQRLASRTGGLRYPVCEFGGFNVVFERIAEDVIDVAAASCTLGPPPGESLDLETVAVTYEPGAGAPAEVLLQVADPADCDDSSFVIDEASGTLDLPLRLRARAGERRRGRAPRRGVRMRPRTAVRNPKLRTVRWPYVPPCRVGTPVNIWKCLVFCRS